jgi:hypothetical protein
MLSPIFRQEEAVIYPFAQKKRTNILHPVATTTGNETGFLPF